MTPPEEMVARADAIVAEMAALGYVRVKPLDKRQDDFNRLVHFLNLKKGASHPKFRELLIAKEDAQVMVYLDLGQMAGDREYASITGYFFPQWILTLLEMEKQWKRSRQAFPEEHDQLMDALHAGLNGDLSEVEKVIGLYELAREYDQDHGVARYMMNPCSEKFLTLNETRAEYGLGEVPNGSCCLDASFAR